MKSLILSVVAVVSAAYATGQQLPAFNLLNVVDNARVTPDRYRDAKGLVIIFTSNECPFDDHYRQRMIRLGMEYAGRVPVLLVNAHTEPAESPAAMADMARALRLTFPYLADKEQTLSNALGVRKSPEAVLFKNDKGTFRLVYRGAIDDNAQVEEDVRHTYLHDAVKAMLAGKAIAAPEVRPVGCNLRKKL